jgi:cyclopropane-fatty-acyl-phospholipid synthase
VALSNSGSQKRFIDARARERGIANLEVVTADVNRFEAGRRFDRILSIEMFEHMRNYSQLLRKIAGWLRPEGKLFVHLFSHRRFSYPFITDGEDDWMARHFFTGGTMPSQGLLRHFQDDVGLQREWSLSGTHYQKTAEAWLANLDRNRDQALRVLASIRGPDEAKRWLVRWRVFFMACSELFGYHEGTEWMVSHYLFERHR